MEILARSCVRRRRPVASSWAAIAILGVALGAGAATAEQPTPSAGSQTPSRAAAPAAAPAPAMKATPVTKVTVRSLPPAQFHGALEGARKMGPVILLDVREPSEITVGQIEGAELMPWNSGVFARDHLRLARDRPVFVYCAHGARSMKAAEQLVAEGWKDVTSLAGGYEDYRAAFPPH